jgi:hypothetical protein
MRADRKSRCGRLIDFLVRLILMVTGQAEGEAFGSRPMKRNFV